MKRVLRLLGYVSWFFTCFTMAAVLLFPLQSFRPLIEDELEKALGKGKQGPHGSDPEVTIGKLSTSGLGVKATRVQVQLGSRDPDPGAVIDVDTLRVSASLFSALSKDKTLQLSGSLYGGDFSADVTVDEKQNLLAADIEVDDVDLSKVPALMAALGLPALGTLKADIALDMGKTPDKDAAGHVDVDIAGLGLGAGSLAVPGGMSFDLGDGIAMGNLKLRMPVEKGQGKITASMEGTPDIEAVVDGSIILRGRLQSSRLDVDGWFRPTAAFLEKKPKIKTALELAEQFALSKAKDDEGRYHFSAKGVIQTLRPQLARDNGRRASAGKK